jgi:Putative Flp pilus-assembly TadE/G-like
MRPNRESERGQVLPLFALFLVALLAMAALAIDVSGAYASRRYYRSVGDSAALAGAQDLQIPGSRNVTSTERIRARTDAMASLKRQLGITGGLPAACSTAVDADVPDTCVLPGTNYHVAIKTPVPACQLCDPNRSVQVGLRNANYELTFARVLGQGTWNVGITSVAGLAFGKAYAIETLKPPETVAGGPTTVKDITVDGGSIVDVNQGDVGSNANMNYSGSGSIMNIDAGYGMFYFDPFNGPTWAGPPIPPGQVVEKLPSLINDPNYTYPAMAGSLGTSSCAPSPGSNCAPTFDDARTASCGAPGATPACTRADLDPACLGEAGKLDLGSYTFMPAQLATPANIYCYNPGIYDTPSSKQLTIGTADLGILKPGAYYFKSGLDVSGRIVGGYEPGLKGVALMFDETGPGNCSSCVFTGNNALTIALNAGTKFPPGTSGTAATAAIDWDSQPVQTSGPGSPTPPLLMTILVRHDTAGPGGTSACFVPTSAPFVEPGGCQDSKNKTINIFGNGDIALEGVQYAPTDNTVIGGNSSSHGQVGQIISWTLKYSGGILINQEGPSNQGPGTLRLDAACTAPSTPCSP